jgi:pimeloyl-ACP methyl ester carboxylesterase
VPLLSFIAAPRVLGSKKATTIVTRGDSLLTEKLNLKHIRMVLGNSMGGMQTWLWGVNHPAFMDTALENLRTA